jgi:transcriptional regulator with XRE-family HTH domain
LAAFLTSRRARLLPESCGLRQASRRRRTPGLRREEVSALAGISTAYYTWIEQGRMFDVSIEILAAIAGALRLNEIEAAHLFTLAGKAPPIPQPAGEDGGEAGTIFHFVRLFDQGPALAVTPWLDVIEANAPARSMLGVRSGENLAAALLCDDGTLTDRRSDAIGAALTAFLRRNYAKDIDNEHFTQLIESLRARSAAFGSLWDRQIVDTAPLFDIEIERDAIGRANFHSVIVSDPMSARQFGLFMSRADS